MLSSNNCDDDEGKKTSSTSGASNADAYAVFLPSWFQPTEKDVICGWARQNHKHPGNRRFRKLVEHSAPLYVAAKTKLEKTNVIARVVEKVRRDSVGGGFVKKDFQSGLWFEIGDDKARDKVGHAIRRVVEDKKKVSMSRNAKKASRSGNDDGEFDQNIFEGRMPLPSLDDFIEVSPMMEHSTGFEPVSNLVSASLINSQNLDGAIVPSFLSHQGNSGNLRTTQHNQEIFGASQMHGNFPSAVDQKSFSVSNIAMLQSQQQQYKLQQQQLQHAMSNGLFQTARAEFQGMISPLPQMQLASNASAGPTNRQGGALFPTNSLATSQLDQNSDIQQARLAALLEERQERINSQLLFQNQTPFSTANSGVVSNNVPNTLGSMGIGGPWPSTLASWGLANPGLRNNSLLSKGTSEPGLNSSITGPSLRSAAAPSNNFQHLTMAHNNDYTPNGSGNSFPNHL